MQTWRRRHGGEGRDSRDAFAELPFADQRAVVEFLLSLQVLPLAEAASPLLTASQAVVVLPGGLPGGLASRRRHNHPDRRNDTL